MAREAAAAAAERTLAWRRRAAEIRVEEKKGPDDLVSQADREAETVAREVLLRRRPMDGVLGEEFEPLAGRSGISWALDPIDGTTNYLYGRPDWAVSVAAMVEQTGEILAGVVAEPALERVTEARVGGGTRTDGRPVRCEPVTDLERALVEINLGRPDQRRRAGRAVDALVPVVRDVRRGGSAAAALAQVATGRADAYWGPGLQPWDAAAGILLVTEAGGHAGDLGGATGAVWPASGDVLASAGGIWPALRDRLQVCRSAP